MATEADPYATLGVRRDASEAEIRDAYRRLARRLHPDVSGVSGVASQGPTMSEVNHAWSILSDPVRRTAHDRRAESMRSGTTDDAVSSRPVVVEPLARPRIPWRLMLGIIIVGSAAVLTAHARTEAPARDTPDQLLQSGSCVDIDAMSLAVEVSCDGPHDAVVRQLIAFDRACPQDSEPHRDRQGMGLACLDKVEVRTGEGSG